VVDPAGIEAPLRVGSGDGDESGAAWSPDGTTIAFLSTLDDPLNMRSGVDVIEVDLTKKTASVVESYTGFAQLTYSPDATLYGVGHSTPDYPSLTSLWRISGGMVDLTGHVDRSIFSFLLPIGMARPDWTEDGFYVGMADSGTLGLIRFRGDDIEAVLDGSRYVTGYQRGDDGSIYFVADDATQPGELYVRDPDGTERQLTRFNDAFRAEVTLVEPDHFRAESEPGVDVDTWLFTPQGDGPFPVLVNIHGGPASQYGFNVFDEFQIYAGAGYAVVACNPCGSSGRGTDWLKAVTGDGWGVVDVTDVTASLNAALARDPRLDGERVGIMGGSYGGFLTAWMTARSDRFRSAVVERALLSWESFAGASDIARDFSERYLGAVPPHGHEVLRAASPLTEAYRITTPTLIVHSDKDFRCPIEQAEQLFMTLLRTGVDVEMVRSPDESHELSRSGSPRHRRERFEAILDWHSSHL
jgi:dipeptidyl aminopeptidase/acylaminoacyl peptidase